MTLVIDRLRTLREQRGWSQRELSRLSGVGESLIRKYEAGISEPSAASLKSIAEQLNVSTDYLLGITDEPSGHLGDGKITDEESQMLDTFRRDGWPGVFRLGAERISK